MPDTEMISPEELLRMTSEVAAAYFSNNTLPSLQLPEVIKTIHESLTALRGGEVAAPAEPPTPAVPIKKSVTPDYIVCLEDGKKLKLYLFTTLEEPAEELVALYGRRWHIELDIRSLKQTLGMHSLRSKTPEMMEKELLLGIAGYNLVRAVQMAAARQANLEPRQLSFSRVQAVIMTAIPRLATITDAAEWEAEYQRVLRWARSSR